MANTITGLEPKALWGIFADICSIPHPSKHEEGLRNYILTFGKKHRLETHVDEAGNVLLRKPAMPGLENLKPVVLQGHLDMVPQKNNDVSHDFEKDPIQPFIDGEWVKARGTTLGSDNGIGVAAALAVLESDHIEHGPLEALFTVDEETGMSGAFGLKAGFMKGDILINLDTEVEGELYIGCAGGTNANIIFGFTEEPVPSGSVSYNIIIKGLKGGHSGVDIHLGRGNSNKILVRYLKHAVKKHGLRLAAIDGGSLRNAIPRESSAVVTIPAAHREEFLKCILDFEQIVKKELSATEPDLKVEATPAALPSSVMDEKTQNRMINAACACPNGVMRMSAEMRDLVETSTNLAIIKSEKNTITVRCLLRSSVDSAKEDLEQMMDSVFTLADAEISFDGQYPGWKPNPDSPILKEMKDIYEKKFGRIPEVRAIHAGLECGIIGGNYPDMDMISLGPTISFPHSPDEMVNIDSVKKFWTFLVETLKYIPAK